MFKELSALMKKPAPYEKGTSEYTAIWTDGHISKGMLEAHLHPDWDAATRNHTAVQKAVKWIASVAPADKYPALLDLGCGPGIYTELFCEEGYQVTGMDLSKRSITHARNSASKKRLPITYLLQDYLTLDFTKQFDLITLIYYDFGVLSPENRARLLSKIYTALNPGGLFIFDVNTPPYLADCEESTSWGYEDERGFFSPYPHLRLDSVFLYEDKRTKCDRHIIITEQGAKSINLWEHTFTKDELTHDLGIAGFIVKDFYGDITGIDYTDDRKEMCVIAQKEEHNHDSI